MTLYDDILTQTKRLTLDEQLRLITYLSKQTRLVKKQKSAISKSWHDLRGITAYPLTGKDAQEWVSASRLADESHRNSLLNGKP